MYAPQWFDNSDASREDAFGRILAWRELFLLESRPKFQKSDVNDNELINAALAGDSAAFGRLVQTYQDRLFNNLVHVVGSVEDARDLVQDAFVQAFVKLSTFKRSAAFYTWLYRIAFNLAVSHRRRRKSPSSLDLALERQGEEPIDDGEAPPDRLEREEVTRQVREALANLPEEYRAILALREIDGCCYDTIAEMLDLPVGTVRSRLHRARQQLRDELKHVLQED